MGAWWTGWCARRGSTRVCTRRWRPTPTAMGQATLVVILSSLAGGIGALAEGGAGGLIGGTIGSLIGWYVWAFLTYYIGTKWLPEPTTQADTGQMLRTLGFASAPGVIRVAGIIPGVGVRGPDRRAAVDARARWSWRCARRSTTRAPAARSSSA